MAVSRDQVCLSALHMRRTPPRVNHNRQEVLADTWPADRYLQQLLHSQPTVSTASHRRTRRLLVKNKNKTKSNVVWLETGQGDRVQCFANAIFSAGAFRP